MSDIRAERERAAVDQPTEPAALFRFEAEHLVAVAERYQGQFAAGEPFPHLVLEDLVPAHVLAAAVDEFPPPDSDLWRRRKKETARKLTSAEPWNMGPVTRQLLAECNGGLFCSFLEDLTGIEGIVPDPHFEGGGMHQSVTGGFLKIHADFNVHPRLRLDRRLNLLLYLNRGWQDEWGGHLELWDRDMTGCVRKVAPVFGQSVVFATTDWSFHGHPDPMRCPPGVTRKSLALYYYTVGRPEETGESLASTSHGTLYQERPGEKIASALARPPLSVRLAAKVRKGRT